jgi:hypothetical protein
VPVYRLASTRSAIVSTWLSSSVRKPSIISCSAMKFGPFMFQCACLVSSARSMASASRALRMLIDTALVFEGRSVRAAALERLDPSAENCRAAQSSHVKRAL